MTHPYGEALDLPRDEDGRIVGYLVGKAHAIAEWMARRERREEDRLLRSLRAKRRRRPVGIDWDAQPLGRVPDVDLARQLGVSANSVGGARRRRGIPPFGTPRPRWTRREDTLIREAYATGGRKAAMALADDLGRTPQAIRVRCNILRLRRQRPAGSVSLTALVERSGYNRRRVENAAVRVGAGLRRDPRDRRRIDVSREQARAILGELAKHPDGRPLYIRHQGEWGPGESCACCGRDSVPRRARGLCSACYERPKRAHHYQGTVRCGACRQPGHNRRTCPKAPT